jgi:DNA primase
MSRATISDYTIKTIKDIPITSILDKEDVPYKKVGREAVTLCPWHNDKNPSLTINNEKGFCFCFVCQTGSDGIGFIQEKFGLSFADTVIKIAKSNEVEVIYEDLNPELAIEEARRKVELMNQLNAEHESYRKFLKDPRASRIRDFLDERNIQPSTSKYFELGYSPRGFFADRITIPIHDHRGTLIGFSGRATRADAKPKYKNSENDDYFDKSKIVFNEYRASRYAREADSLIFVEGHLDVIALWQYGIKNVVALQGTATPSESTLNRLAKRTKRFILCFDADQGGFKATEQFIKAAGPMACRGGLTLSVAALPEGTDPDDCVNSGIDFYSIIENAKPWLDWQLDTWLTSIDRTDTALFTEVESRIRSLVDSIQSPALRQYYIDKSSRILAADPHAAQAIAKQWVENTGVSRYKKIWSKPSPGEIRAIAERRLLRLYVHFPEVRTDTRPWMEKLQSPAHKWLWQRILDIESCYSHDDILPVLMGLYCVCEPHYTRQLRSIAQPTIKVRKDPGIMDHIYKTLSQELIIDGI